MSDVDEQLYQAVERGDVRAASEALGSGASANYIHLRADEDKHFGTMTYRTPVLYVACESKNEEMVDLLLAAGADPNGKHDENAWFGPRDKPCLHAAIPSVTIVRALLEKGADPNVRVWYGEECARETALLDEVHQGHRELIALLKEHGALGIIGQP